MGAFGFGSSNNYQAPLAPIDKAATDAQANQLYGQVQQGLTQQEDFLKALQAQNGIQNQSAVYNQLAGIAAGQGPNPAQAMLAQATGANVANQAALAAGQRGASANVGLLNRQAAQAGAGAQQAAAGQAATLQAQQSLGALGQMGGLATQQVGQQGAATQAYTGATQQEQQQILNQIASQNAAAVGAQQAATGSNTALAQQKLGAQQGLFGGVFNAIGGAGASALTGGGKAAAYEGGAVDDGEVKSPKENMAFGGNVADKTPQQNKYAHMFDVSPGQNMGQSGPAGYSSGYQAGSGIAQGLMALGSRLATPGAPTPSPAAPSQAVPGVGYMTNENYAKGGKVPAMVSPGEIYLPPHKVPEAKHDGKKALRKGQLIPGKAKVKGDSIKNDTVPKTLEEGGVVIPRSVVNSKDPKKVQQFIAAALKKAKKA